MIEHPVITNMELTGYPDGKEPETPHCPICGKECESLYLADEITILGCENCVRLVDAEEFILKMMED